MDVSFLCLLCQSVDALHLAERSKGDGGQSLSLPSLEEACTVYSGQQPGLAPYRTDLVQLAVVYTDALVQDHGSHGLLGDSEQQAGDVRLALREDLREVLLGLYLYCVHIVQTLHLILGVDRLFHLICGKCSDLSLQILVDLIELDIHLGLADFCNDLVDEFYDLLDLLVGKPDSVQHLNFRNLVGAGFYHHDGFLGACYGQVDVRLCSLLQRRVDDELAVHSADTDGTGGTIPGNVRNRDGYGRSDHGHDVSLTVRIYGHDGGYNADVVIESLGEQRTERTVHEAAAQYGLLTGSSFSSDEAAGHLACSIHLLFIVAGQGEEIRSLSWLLGRAYGYVNYGIAVTHPDLAVCLLADLADL